MLWWVEAFAGLTHRALVPYCLRLLVVRLRILRILSSALKLAYIMNQNDNTQNSPNTCIVKIQIWIVTPISPAAETAINRPTLATVPRIFPH